MKKLALLVLLLSTMPAWAIKVTPSEYTIDVHVTAEHWIITGTGGIALETLINGKKYELSMISSSAYLLPLGDYKARLTTNKSNSSGETFQVYQLLLPDGKAQSFIVTGLSE